MVLMAVRQYPRRNYNFAVGTFIELIKQVIKTNMVNTARTSAAIKDNKASVLKCYNIAHTKVTRRVVQRHLCYLGFGDLGVLFGTVYVIDDDIAYGDYVLLDRDNENRRRYGCDGRNCEAFATAYESPFPKPA